MSSEPRRPGELRPPIRIALAATAGALTLLTMPPRGLWLFLPAGIALLTLAVHGASWRARLLVGATAGATFFGPGLFWLTSFNAIGYVAVVAVEAGLFAGAMILVPGRHRGWWTVPAALVLLETVRARFPFGGLPLPGLALGQVDGPFAAAAGLGGSLLVAALPAVAGTALVAPILARRRALAVATAVLTASLPLGAGAMLPTRQTGSLDVAVVQGGGPRGIPAIRSDPSQVTERHFAASNQITNTPDLVLWPESAVYVEQPVARSPQGARLSALARRLDTTLVAGVIEDDGDRFRNAAVGWDPDGALRGRYEKVHRVPFGEYIPLRGLFELLSDDTAFVPRDAVPGRGPGMLETDAGPLGVVISYEVFFSDRARAAANAGGRVLLVPTNAASYTTDEVPSMEVAAARLRARELNQAVLQAAPTGYSAVILPDGRVIEQSGLERRAVLSARVPLQEQRTPYTRTGDWPVVTLAVVALLLGALTGRHSTSSNDPSRRRVAFRQRA
ncbi:MAG: apolipoprotein N-acyltransferase [Streptosporangiales bacterium]|nr:apolipoprotein N-acyltransferase [Streptosporangiales bacterium]